MSKKALEVINDLNELIDLKLMEDSPDKFEKLGTLAEVRDFLFEKIGTLAEVRDFFNERIENLIAGVKFKIYKQDVEIVESKKEVSKNKESN
jgi:hypothetical protein